MVTFVEVLIGNPDYHAEAQSAQKWSTPFLARLTPMGPRPADSQKRVVIKADGLASIRVVPEPSSALLSLASAILCLSRPRKN